MEVRMPSLWVVGYVTELEFNDIMHSSRKYLSNGLSHT
jgi:hypothetical protein